MIELIEMVEKHNTFITINYVGGLPGGGIPGQLKKTGKAKVKIYVL